MDNYELQLLYNSLAPKEIGISGQDFEDRVLRECQLQSA